MFMHSIYVIINKCFTERMNGRVFFMKFKAISFSIYSRMKYIEVSGLKKEKNIKQLRVVLGNLLKITKRMIT